MLEYALFVKTWVVRRSLSTKQIFKAKYCRNISKTDVSCLSVNYLILTQNVCSLDQVSAEKYFHRLKSALRVQGLDQN